jgi:flagellar biosynthesis/type III secretory pathway protein FliH
LEIYYNSECKEEISNAVKWGAFLNSDNFEEMSSLLEELVTDDERNKIMSRLNNIKSEDLIWSAEEAQEWMEWQNRSDISEAEERGIELGRTEGIELGRTEGIELGRTEGIELGRTEGIELGKIEGIENEKINMIKSMLENNLEYEFISKVSGKSIDEIKEIEKSIEEK